MEAPLRGRKRRKAIVVLEDGSSFSGYGFGATKKAAGEVVFSTGMVGYTEALTDPSYYGQILTLTYPLVGNYGVPRAGSNTEIPPPWFESDGIKVKGLVVQNLCETPSHWASSRTLNDWLLEEGVPGICGVDTRQLTKKLRERGVMLGILEVCGEDEEPNLDGLRKEAASILDPNKTDLVKMVAVKRPISCSTKSGNRRAVVIDCGVKAGILHSLLHRGFAVTRVPYDFASSEIAKLKPDLVVVSNGPGDPRLRAIAFVSILDSTFWSLSFPFYNLFIYKQLGATTEQLGIAVAIMSASPAISALVLGPMLDKWRTTWFLALSEFMALGAITPILLAMAPEVAYFASIFWGLVYGLWVPAINSFILDTVGNENFARATGNLTLLTGIFSTPSAAIAGWLYDNVSPKAPFITTLIAAIVIGVLIFVLLRGPKSPARTRC